MPWQRFGIRLGEPTVHMALPVPSADPSAESAEQVRVPVLNLNLNTVVLTLSPQRTFKNPVTGGDIQYFEVEIKEFTQNVYPGKGPAKLVGYDGMAPGPTFHIEKGTEAVVRFINNGNSASSIHLHGSFSVCYGCATDLGVTNQTCSEPHLTVGLRT